MGVGMNTKGIVLTSSISSSGDGAIVVVGINHA